MARSVVVVRANGYEIGPGADLSGAYLVLAELRWAELWWANLEGANLSGTNLRGQNLSTARLTGATADSNTTWPKGFDPKAAGVIFVDTE